MHLNRKGFVSFTIIYSLVILLSFLLLFTLQTLESEYSNNLEYIEDINNSLNDCLNKREC